MLIGDVAKQTLHLIIRRSIMSGYTLYTGDHWAYQERIDDIKTSTMKRK